MYGYLKLFLASNDELHNECEANDGTDTAMDVGLLGNVLTYEDVVAVLGKPQRITNDTNKSWGSVVFEWDIGNGGSVYKVQFNNIATYYGKEVLEMDIGDMRIIEKELKYPNGTPLDDY